MNYMVYMKGAEDKQFGAMNLKEGTYGVGLVYATLIPDLERAKGYANTLAKDIRGATFQVRPAGKTNAVYEISVKPISPTQTLCKYCGQPNGSNDENVLCKECRECFGHSFYNEL